MKILITGASGFVGSELAAALARHGHAVAGVRHRSVKGTSVENVQWIQADLLQPWDFDFTPDCIVHAAAVLPHESYRDQDAHLGNVRLMNNLLAWASPRGPMKIVNLSSMAVYGDSAELVLKADSPTNAVTPYARGKLEAENLLQSATRFAVLQGISIRLPAVVGGFSHHNFPSDALQKVLADQPVSIVNPNSKYNHIIHIDELRDFISQTLARDGDHYQNCVVASAEPLAIRAFIEQMFVCAGRAPQIIEKSSGRGCPLIEFERATDLGFRACSVRDTLRRFVADVVRVRAQKQLQEFT